MTILKSKDISDISLITEAILDRNDSLEIISTFYSKAHPIFIELEISIVSRLNVIIATMIDSIEFKN